MKMKERINYLLHKYENKYEKTYLDSKQTFVDEYSDEQSLHHLLCA